MLFTDWLKRAKASLRDTTHRGTSHRGQRRRIARLRRSESQGPLSHTRTTRAALRIATKKRTSSLRSFDSSKSTFRQLAKPRAGFFFVAVVEFKLGPLLCPFVFLRALCG